MTIPGPRRTKTTISRRLLEAADGKGNYVAIVEHRSEETFRAMRASEDRERVSIRVEPLLVDLLRRWAFDMTNDARLDNEGSREAP